MRTMSVQGAVPGQAPVSGLGKDNDKDLDIETGVIYKYVATL